LHPDDVECRAENALPQSATATINCRIFPGVAVSEVSDALAQLGENTGLEIKALDDSTIGLASPLRDDIVAAVRRTVTALYSDVPIIPIMSAYTTDAVEIRATGIPTYVVGGLFMREEDDFSHGLNERGATKRPVMADC
jgi:acetylornithine deacetylase/succinyl-diaminopimelate desuccinylase-like protein